DNRASRAALAKRLAVIGDIERLTSRAALGQAHARDLVALRGYLHALPDLRDDLAALDAAVVTPLAADVVAPPELIELLDQALEDEPPLGLREGGMIRETWNSELRDLEHGAHDARQWIASLEQRERGRTGIGSLRVRFNRVFGYAIEVGNAHAAKVPPDYLRRQTLVGAERYVTAELKEYESRVLGAEERIAQLEFALFAEVRSRVAAHAEALLRTARAVGTLDVLVGLAEVAHERGHVRPAVDDSPSLEIVDGRHPVLESGGAVSFTPNDVRLDPDGCQIVILTGP